MAVILIAYICFITLPKKKNDDDGLKLAGSVLARDSFYSSNNDTRTMSHSKSILIATMNGESRATKNSLFSLNPTASEEKSRDFLEQLHSSLLSAGGALRGPRQK